METSRSELLPVFLDPPLLAEGERTLQEVRFHLLKKIYSFFLTGMVPTSSPLPPSDRTTSLGSSPSSSSRPPALRTPTGWVTKPRMSCRRTRWPRPVGLRSASTTATGLRSSLTQTTAAAWKHFCPKTHGGNSGLSRDARHFCRSCARSR